VCLLIEDELLNWYSVIKRTFGGYFEFIINVLLENMSESSEAVAEEWKADEAAEFIDNSSSPRDQSIEGEQHEDPTEETHVSFALRRFENEDFVTEIIGGIPEIVQDPVKSESRLDRLKDLLDRYQEQPQLVDPYLGSSSSPPFFLTLQCSTNFFQVPGCLL
jgi:hypothetical protein